MKSSLRSEPTFLRKRLVSIGRFRWLTALDPACFLLRGYAVLADATMPVIGDPETMNDTYIEQITAAAHAHIAIAEGSRVTNSPVPSNWTTGHNST
jgi:hypothetical protein